MAQERRSSRFPYVAQHHSFAGCTRASANHQDPKFALISTFPKKVNGLIPLEVSGQQTILLKMDQWGIALRKDYIF